MKARNVTRDEMYEALDKTNEIYSGNVEFNRFEGSRVFNFTLRVKDSLGPGARRGWTGRRMVAACWHVHGHFFEKLIEINPNAEIVSCYSKISAAGGNWQDRNIGSMVQPLYYSEACECY
jgi:hypothetical protein